MNDLDLVRELRADVPSPAWARLAPGRARLLASISRQSRPRKLRRAILPAGAAASAAVAIEAAGRSSSDRRARARSAVRRTARRGVWVSVAAAATVAVGGGALMLAPRGSQHASSEPAVQRRTSPGAASHPAGPVSPVYRRATLTAAVVLDKAAAAAARQDNATGKYFFTETEGIGTIRAATLPDGGVYRTGPSLRQNWFGNGVDGRLIQAVGAPWPFGRTITNTSSSSVGMTWAQLRSLPTAPGPLLAIVAQNAVAFPKSPDSTASGEFEFIQELLLENPIPPAVQAALYRVAAGLPGIKAVDTTDLVGRPAIEVYVEPGPDAPAVGQALYFSPVTFQLLGEAVLSDAANLSCPVDGSTAILATGYVSSDTQLPAGTPTKLKPAYYSNSAPGCPGTLLTGTPPWMRGKLGQAALRRLAERRERH
jgi:hypothetical protein